MHTGPETLSKTISTDFVLEKKYFNISAIFTTLPSHYIDRSAARHEDILNAINPFNFIFIDRAQGRIKP